MMSVGLHMRIIGHPGRAAGLWRLLDYMQQQKGVWITRRLDIANHWKHAPVSGQGPERIARARYHRRRFCHE